MQIKHRGIAYNIMKIPVVENLHSPFEHLLSILQHDAMVLDLSQPVQHQSFRSAYLFREKKEKRTE